MKKRLLPLLLLFIQLSHAYPVPLTIEANTTWQTNTTFQITVTGGNNIIYNCETQSKSNLTTYATINYDGVPYNQQINTTWNDNTTYEIHFLDQTLTGNCNDYPQNHAHQATYNIELSNPTQEFKYQNIILTQQLNQCTMNQSILSQQSNMYQTQMNTALQSQNDCFTNLSTLRLGINPASLNPTVNLSELGTLQDCQINLSEAKGRINAYLAQPLTTDLYTCNQQLGSINSRAQLNFLLGLIFASLVWGTFVYQITKKKKEPPRSGYHYIPPEERNPRRNNRYRNEEDENGR